MLEIRIFEGELGKPSAVGGYQVNEHDDGTVSAVRLTSDGMCSARDVSAILRKSDAGEGAVVYELYIGPPYSGTGLRDGSPDTPGKQAETYQAGLR